jgi:hypothetical protein
MAAKNVNMVDQVQEQEPPKPPSYGELIEALKQATTAFISTHITNILSSFIKEHNTIQHIITTLGQQIHVNDQLNHIRDLLTPYTNLDSMAEEHITANN